MIGRVLGSYRIDRELGRGGMGQVYLAEHVKIGKRAAVKVLLPERASDPALVQRFFNEARAAAGIRHPGMVEVFDFGTDEGGRSYLIMEWLDGESLAARLRRGRPSHAQALDIARQVASALAAAHAQDIIHRDLKPDNLFLVPDAAVAAGLRVKVLDFGIAKLGAGAVGGASITASDAIIGTPLYMAPEQCEGGRPIDARADMYSLGAILFELVTGRPPFVEKGAGAVIAAHLKTPPPAPRSLAPDLPADIDALILRLLAKEPDARGAGMQALYDELDRMCAAHPPERITDPGRSIDALAATQASSRDALASAETAASSPAALAPTAASVDARSSTASSSAAEMMTPAGPAPTKAAAQVPSTEVPKRGRKPLLAAGAAVLIAGGAVAAWKFWPRSGSLAPAAAQIERATPDQLQVWCDDGVASACHRLGVLIVRGNVGDGPPDFTRAAAVFGKACELKLAVACTQEGILAEYGQGAPLDHARAGVLYQKGCDGGDGLGCAGIAGLVVAGLGVPSEPERGLELRKRGCELGSGQACSDYAHQLEFGLGVPADLAASSAARARALELASNGCDAGEPRDCRQAGLIYQLGRGVAKDPKRAPELLQRACDGGEPGACSDLSQVYLFGAGVGQDVARGVDLMTRSCNRGSIEGCAGLGMLYTHGIGVVQDGGRARRLLEELCTKHGDSQCVPLAGLYSTGVGVPVSLEKQHVLTEKACLAGVGYACAAAAEHYIKGVGVLPDAGRARDLHERGRILGDAQSWVAHGESLRRAHRDAEALNSFDVACRLSDGFHCDKLAEMYFDGIGVAVDRERAAGILDRACTEGSPTACISLAERIRDGRGIAADVPRAIKLFEAACDRSFAKGCTGAADMLFFTKPVEDAEFIRLHGLRRRACQLDPGECSKIDKAPVRPKPEKPPAPPKP